MTIKEDRPVYGIGTVSRMTGLSPRQIRYYEDADLVAPIRSQGNQRQYSAADVARLQEVKALFAKGHNLEGIKAILMGGKTRTASYQDHPDLAATYQGILPTGDLASRFPGPQALKSLYPVTDQAGLIKHLTFPAEAGRSKKE